MAHQGKRQLFWRDATAIVAHTQQLHAAAFQLHGYFGGTRIQAVFQHLLKRSSRTFDNFACSDLVDEQIR